MYLRAGYLSKLVDREARHQLARLQLTREGSIFESRSAHYCCAVAISSDDQLARLELAPDQLARSGSAAVPRP
jgi:hypothetical protein